MNYYHGHHQAIEEIRKSVSRRSKIARNSRGRTRDQVEELEDEVMFLNLVNRVVINLLMKRGLCTREELVELLSELDREDGVIDGGSTGDDLARDLGFDELPVDRAEEPPKAPTPSRKRGR